MTPWKGRTRSGAFAVEFPSSVLTTLDRYCGEAGTVETGGILIGRHSSDLSVALVREATPPPSDSRRGRSWFVRGVRGLREMLRDNWQRKERTFYLGEWHFHPASRVEPSHDDFAQMVQIAQAREYDCREPLLLILGARRQKGRRIFRAFVCNGGGIPLEFHNAEEREAVGGAR